MNTNLDCLPCLFRQVIDAGRLVSSDESFHRELVKQAAFVVAESCLDSPPPVLAGLVHRKLRSMVGDSDPWREIRLRQNRLALNILPQISDILSMDSDQFGLATRLAIAGNIIDLGSGNDPTDVQLLEAVLEAVNKPVTGDFEAFRALAAQAGKILYIADNAGEIVFDRLLVEQLDPRKVVLVVRGAPVINDAVREDARIGGLEDLVPVIESGSDIPGIVLSECSLEFRQAFKDADLIIAKGQGNFETMSDLDANIVFLLKIKCPVVSTLTNLPTGTAALILHRQSPGKGAV